MRRLAVIGVFFFSGAAALVYQVVWTRQLSLIFGVTTYAVATVLATFMGGLALGSYVFGRWSDANRTPLRAYALLEAGIGAYALLVPSLFAALRPAYVGLAHLDLAYVTLAFARALLAAGILLLPTTLMGGTFPILVRFFVRTRGEIGRTAGVLYFVNTAGAMAGCLAAGFYLIEHFGLLGTTRIAAATSLTAAACSALLARRAGPLTAPAEATPMASSDGPAVPVTPIGVRLVLVCIGVSGFASFGYEVLWTRALLRYLYNSTYAFTTMLATFLAGLAIGSALHAALLRKRRHPLLLFGLLEAGVGLGFAVSAVVFPYLRGASAGVLGSEMITSFGESVLTMFIRAALILLPAAICLGATLPLATEVCAQTLARLGGTVGRVYAINTVGCIAGSLIAGFVLIPWIGMHGTLMLLIAINLGLALLLIAAEELSLARRLVAGGAVAAAAAALWPALPHDLFRRTFGAQGQEIIFYREGATDTVAVAQFFGQRVILYDDQRGTAGTNSFRENYLLGHLPMLLHPGTPRRVLHICFGVGNSLSAVAAHESLERVDNVELSPHVLDAAHYFWTNAGVLSHPKVRTIIDDGRNYVMAAREQYDVILLEPPEMFTAGVINLYTREFYRYAASRLAPGGLMMQWLPYAEAPIDDERRFFRAFYDVFPDATAWRLLEGGPILMIGSTEPLTIDYQRLKARMQEPRVRRDLELIGIQDVDHLLALFIFDTPAFRDFALGAPPITDDVTVLDFSMPRFIGTGFGLGTFNRNVQENGQGPFGAVMQRGQYYYEQRCSVVPLLTNLDGEDPRAIQARIDARARPIMPQQPFIAQPDWRRWD